MHLDVEDVLLNAIGTVFGKIILFIVAVWMGCMVGGLGIVAGSMIEHRDWPSVSWGSILACPLLLLSSWALLNIPFLFISLIRFIRSDGDGYLTWGIVIAVEALFGMLGYVRDEMKGWVPMAVAW
ncbi:MAG: hypothetical protein H8M99_03270, partial [Gloeobacteraceae cyanobacterium ES-bin-144]|nr:hypothetical protein [Verrucomicrobiales bacterium]